MAEVNGNIAVPGGQIGSGEAQVFNPAPTLQLLAQMQERADNQAKLDALAKMKQQEAEAKAKEAQQVKMPLFDAATDGIFGGVAGKMIPDVSKTAIQNIYAKPYDQQNLALETSNAKNQIANINNINKTTTKAFFDTAKQLKDEGYDVDPNTEAVQYDASEWFGKDVASDFYKKVTSDPNKFNYALLGDSAEKNIATKTVKVKKADGKEHDEIVPIIANYNDKENKLEITASEAIPYLEQIPSIKKQLPYVYRSILEKNKVDPSIIDKPYEQLTPEEKGSMLTATKEVVDKYLGGRLGFTVVDNFEKTPEPAGSKTKLPYTKSIGSRSSFTFNMYDAGGNVMKDADSIPFIQDGTWTDSNAENYNFKKPQVANANIRAFVLSNPEEALAAGLVVKNKKGGYTLKQGFQYQLASKQKRPIAKEDITFYKPNGAISYIVKEGTPIDDNTYQSIKNDPNKDKLKKVRMDTGYEVTANVRYPNYDADGVPVDSKGNQIKGGAFPTIKLFIPEDDATDIKTAIKQQGEGDDTEELDINSVWGKK